MPLSLMEGCLDVPTLKLSMFLLGKTLLLFPSFHFLPPWSMSQRCSRLKLSSWTFNKSKMCGQGFGEPISVFTFSRTEGAVEESIYLLPRQSSYIKRASWQELCASELEIPWLTLFLLFMVLPNSQTQPPARGSLQGLMVSRKYGVWLWRHRWKIFSMCCLACCQLIISTTSF